MTMPRNRLSPEYWRYKKVVRQFVYKRDNYTCQYCGFNMKILYELYLQGIISHRASRLTLDHLVAKRMEDGYKDYNSNNLVTSCSTCNVLKGDMNGVFIYPTLIIN